MKTALSVLVLLPLGLAALSLCSGCAALAAIGSTVVVTEEFQDNALTATVEEDSSLVWASAKASLANMTDALIQWDDDHKVATTTIDNAEVTVEVANYGVRETQIRIAAKKILVYNQELAELVQRRIVKDLSAS